MIIRLQEGERKSEVEGDDDLIEKSLPYAGVFERTVKEVTAKFYGCNTGDHI